MTLDGSDGSVVTFYLSLSLQRWRITSRHLPLHLRVYQKQVSRPLLGGAINILDGWTPAVWSICLGHHPQRQH